MLNYNIMLNKMSSTKSRIITRQDWLIYSSQAHVPRIELGYIFGSIEVCVEGISASLTLKESRMSNSISIVTSVAFFGSISRINIDNSNSFSKSLVFNKVLELPESPLVNPFVIFGSLSDSRNIFHDNNISLIQTINDSSTNIVVSPSHQQFPVSREVFELSPGSFCAYRLKLAHKSIMPDSFLLNIFSIESSFTCHSEIINPNVNAKNSFMLIRAKDINVGAERKHEERSVESVNHQQTLTDFPFFEIGLITFRNRNIEFSSSLYCRNTQEIILEGSRTGKVVSHGSPVDNGPGLSFFNHPTSLFDTGNSKLAWQSHFPDVEVNKRMELDIIPNLHLPSSIYTELQGSGVNTNSFTNFSRTFNFNLSTCPNQHLFNIYSNYLNLSEGSIPPTIKMVGILEHFL